MLRKFRALPVFIICVLAGAFSISGSGCTKTETVVVQPDSVKIVKNLMIGKWNVQHIERALYSGSSVTGNQIENFAGSNTYTEFKADMTYTSIYKGAAAGTGTWDILSPYYMVMDKGNASQERYYYIFGLDRSVLITHGPFKQNGTLFLPAELDDLYYSK